MKKILVYSHDGYGLGNIRRMVTIAESLVQGDDEVSILLISGSPLLNSLDIPRRLDYLKLPSLSRNTSTDFALEFRGRDYDAMVRLRSNLILTTVIDFDPDIVLVDRAPLGMGEELAPTVNLLRHRASRARMVLVLGDILDRAEQTRQAWDANDYYDVIENSYDSIMAAGSPEISDLATEYGLPPACAAKLTYCGYLRKPKGRIDRDAFRARLGVGRDPMVLVTGGGGEDGYRLLSCYIHGINTLPQNMAIRSVLLCGPEMAPSRRDNLREAASGNPRIQVEDYTDDMMSHIEAADLVVSMGGYNTVCEILSRNKSAIIVPRVRPSTEQLVRAQRMAALGLLRTIHPDELSPRILVQAVRRELVRAGTRRSVGRPIDLQGVEKFRDQVHELMRNGCISVKSAYGQLATG